MSAGCGWPWSAPAGGASSTRASSPGRPDTELVAIVGAHRGARRRRGPQLYGTTAYTDIAEMLERARPDLVTVCLPNEEHFAPTLELDPGRRPAAGREAAGVRPRRGRAADAEAAARATCSSPSTSTTATPSRCSGRGAAIEAGRAGRASSTSRGASAARPTPGQPAPQPDRDPVPRLRHARAPGRPDRLGDGADDATGPSRRATTRWPSRSLRQRRGGQPGRQLRLVLRLSRRPAASRSTARPGAR